MTMHPDPRPMTEEERSLKRYLVDQARDLAPLLAANAARTESGRVVVAENILALRNRGLLSLLRPKRFAGLEASFRTQLEVTRELAKSCGSTAWVACHLNIGSWFAGMCIERAQNDVWEEENDNVVAGVFAASGAAENIAGGYVVTGRWSHVSGYLHADWAVVGVTLSAEEEHCMVLIPLARLSVEDTWHSMGMRGAGSHTLVADGVFVPAHRTVPVSRRIDEALFRVPLVLGATVNLVGPQLGLAEAALSATVERAARRGVTNTFHTRRADSPAVQFAVAEASSLIGSATLLAFRAADTIDEAGLIGVVPGYLTRARTTMDASRAIVQCREAIRTLMSVNGASAFDESDPLHRIWRDSEVASRYAAADPDRATETYGRALLGFGRRSTMPSEAS